jgi:hypothetical protein
MTTLQRVAMERFVGALAFIFGCLLALLGLHTAEQRFAPVNVDWVVASKVVDGNDVVIQGTMRKRRACEFIAPPRARTIDGVSLQVKSMGSGLSWAPSSQPQQYGPWRIYGGAASTFEMYLVHRCHPLWLTFSALGKVQS